MRGIPKDLAFGMESHTMDTDITTNNEMTFEQIIGDSRGCEIHHTFLGNKLCISHEILQSVHIQHTIRASNSHKTCVLCCQANRCGVQGALVAVLVKATVNPKVKHMNKALLKIENSAITMETLE